MNYLLSVDPGLRKSGAALWHDGELVSAKLIEPDCDDSGVADVADVVAAMSSDVRGWCANVYDVDSAPRARAIEALKPWLRLVCEYPRTYGGRAGKGDANDLISVALVAGAILGRLGCPSQLVLPREWKGGIPKPQTKAEYLRDGYPVEERVKLKLTTTELIRVELTRDWWKNMDIWDALGIGLWALKR